MSTDAMKADHEIRCATCHVSCSSDGQISTHLREAFLSFHQGDAHHVTETGRVEP